MPVMRPAAAAAVTLAAAAAAAVAVKMQQQQQQQQQVRLPSQQLPQKTFILRKMKMTQFMVKFPPMKFTVSLQQVTMKFRVLAVTAAASRMCLRLADLLLLLLVSLQVTAAVWMAARVQSAWTVQLRCL
jgi:hypothetical protein